MNTSRARRSTHAESKKVHIVGIIALILFFVVAIALVAALAFSVRVTGQSMRPTLQDGDRLVSNFLNRTHVQRFDLVQTAAGEGGVQVVKRVIGMPGDQVAIQGDPKLPVVLLRVKGATPAKVVDNPAWPGRIGERTQSCCNDKGQALATGKLRWLTVPPQHYWLLGDNWGESDDSRVFGLVSQAEIGATLDFRLLPLGEFGALPNHVRLTDR